MNTKYSLIVVGLMLLAAGILIIMDNPDSQANLSSVMELLGDAQQTATKPLMMTTKVSAAEEQKLGKRLSSYMRFRSNENNNEDFKKSQAYVTRLGKSLLSEIERKEIQYEFHLIDNKTVNAFALPGGQIFVFTGLLDFVKSEAELATILGHEISHVDAKHCIELFQAELAAKKIGGPLLDNILAQIAMRYATMVITGGYRKFQEFEADAGGFRLAALAGYDPGASEEVMKRLGRKFSRNSSRQKAHNPLAEAGKMVVVAANNYFASHPPTSERVSKIRALCSKFQKVGKRFYRGKKNLQKRKVMQVLRLEEEFVTY
ncbi:MAG: M48 family metallopeptidase [Candidatus Rifleibacteriota bacterium]